GQRRELESALGSCCRGLAQRIAGADTGGAATAIEVFELWLLARCPRFECGEFLAHQVNAEIEARHALCRVRVKRCATGSRRIVRNTTGFSRRALRLAI